MSSALQSCDVVALNPQLFITATFVGLVVLFALGITALVLIEQRSPRSGREPGVGEHASRPPEGSRDRWPT